MLWLAIIGAVFYAGLIGIATGLWISRKTNTFIHQVKENHQDKFSILIPFRNEANHLEHLAQSLNHQSLNKDQWECIFIDDQSTDYGFEKLNQTLNFNSTKISSTGEGKKAALAQGILIAKNEYIVQTDADSITGPHWLSSILQEKSDQANVVITGPVAIHKPITILDHFQAFDMLALMGMTYAGINTGWWYMGNGANLSYPKSLKSTTGKNSNNDQYASGDDMFLIESAILSRKYSVLFNFNPEAIVYTSSCPDINSFIQQRLRWGSKNTAMKSWGLKIALGISLVFNILLVWMLVNSIFIHALVLPTILLWSQKLIIDFIYLNCIGPFFKSKINILHYLICSIIYPFFIVCIVVLSIFKRKYEWKGRVVQ